MHYYEHHLGDYAEATSHLSFVEDAAYSRCIRKYYSTESALPTDIKAVQRLIGARSKEERDAVEAILKEFFTLEADGWHNERCDEDIARYTDKRQKAKRSADARWNAKPSDSEGNANASDTHTERIAKAERTHSEGNALQSPIPNPQSPTKKPSLRSGSAHVRARPSKHVPESFEVSEAMREWAKSECPTVDADAETKKFRDHEFKAAHTDWPKAWRRWMRTAPEFRRNGVSAEPVRRWVPTDEEVDHAGR